MTFFRHAFEHPGELATTARPGLLHLADGVAERSVQVGSIAGAAPFQAPVTTGVPHAGAVRAILPPLQRPPEPLNVPEAGVETLAAQATAGPFEADRATPPPRRRSRLEPFGRDLTKTITFLILHLLVGFTVAYLFTGSIAIASGIALVEPLVNAVVFFFHERAWRRTDVPLLDILTHRHSRSEA